MALAFAITKHGVPRFEELQQLFTELIAKLRPGAALLVVNSELCQTSGFHIELRPNSTTSARIAARITNKGVVLFLGQGAIFEVPSRGHRYTDLDCLDEVRTLSTGVIEGHFDETLMLSAGLIIGATGRVSFGDSIACARWHKAFVNPFRKREKVTKKYDPYPTSS